MPTLILKFKDNVLGTFPVASGKSLTVGRKQGNEILIENLAVSGHHAKIDAVGDGYLLTDLQSKNGSFVNKELVTSTGSSTATSITIGKHTIEFAYDDGEARPDEEMGSMDQTMVMDTDKYRDMLAQAVPKSEAPAAAREPLGILSYLVGGEGESS